MIKFWSYKKEYKKHKKSLLSVINKSIKKGSVFFGEDLKKTSLKNINLNMELP